MVTTPDEEPVVTPAEQAEDVARIILAGHPQGAVRRIVLYLITFTLVLTYPQAAIIPLLLLALTDELV